MSLSCALLLLLEMHFSFVLSNEPLSVLYFPISRLLLFLLLLILLILCLLFPLLLSLLPLLVLLGQGTLCLVLSSFSLLLLLLLEHLRSQLGLLFLLSFLSGLIVIVLLCAFERCGNLAGQGGRGTDLCHLLLSRLSILLSKAADRRDEIVHIRAALAVSLRQKELIIVDFT